MNELDAYEFPKESGIEQESTPEQLGALVMDPLDADRWLAVLDRLEERYIEGEKALAAGQWQIALAALEEIAENDPDFRDVQQKLVIARDEYQLVQWCNEASAYGEAGHWVEACRIWIQVLRKRPDYHDGDAVSGLVDATSEVLNQYEALKEKLE